MFCVTVFICDTSLQYMDKIGVVYCGVDPPKKPEGGIGGLEGIFGEFKLSQLYKFSKFF